MPLTVYSFYLAVVVATAVGYTMSDIRYKWAKGEGSFEVANDVSLPQFAVWGYKQRANEIILSTGKSITPALIAQLSHFLNA